MQVLYRKYRPKTFDEFEGQEHVVRTLQGALISGRVGHAYLFCGPRGTGKTTMARLFAKILNCPDRQKSRSRIPDSSLTNRDTLTEPCNVCFSCNEINEGRSLDLIEIDAASNRGIDEIRNLKDSARVAAPSGGYKIFIIDEVHMLTPPAFNALLKTLEEPPSHVIFILATTESHKIMETILSRVQRLDFKKITVGKIIEKLKKIAKSEQVEIDEPALAMLASTASGSLRDAESALSKLMAYTGKDKKITTQEASEILGIVPLEAHHNILNLILKKKPQEAIVQLANLYESGIDLDHFVKQFVHYLRSSLIDLITKNSGLIVVATTSNSITPEFLIKVITAFMKAGSEIKSSPIPQLPLELAILELTK